MKPGDFLLGVFEFFAILLPGMIATWLAAQYVPAGLLRDGAFFTAAAPQTASWLLVAVFLIASYTLGHFVFMLSAQLDHTYDGWRRRAKPLTRDTAFRAARALQETLNRELAGSAFTPLKWAKAYILVNAQHARVEIDRLEAEQKFFRSLVVVAAALAAHFFLSELAPVAGLAAVVLGVLAYHRYLEQRWKWTELIYATAVIVHQSRTSPSHAAQATLER